MMLRVHCCGWIAVSESISQSVIPWHVFQNDSGCFRWKCLSQGTSSLEGLLRVEFEWMDVQFMLHLGCKDLTFKMIITVILS